MPGGAHENMKAWEPEEDHIIMQMVLQEGPKWKLIVKQLPGRTVSSVRNRWQRIEKGRKLRDEGAELKNRCHACGEPKRGHICKKRSRGGPQVDLPTPPVASMGLNLGLGGDQPTPLDTSSLFAPGIPGLGSAGGGMSGGMSGGHPSQPPLRRTRSGSRLVPDGGPPSLTAGGNVTHGLYGGGGMMPPPPSNNQMPPLQRSNTSFFQILANESGDLFSPSSREMFQAWAQEGGPPTANLQQSAGGLNSLLGGGGGPLSLGGGGGGGVSIDIANDPMAPPALRHVASREGMTEPPKLTRSISSYLRDVTEGPAASPAMMPSGAAALTVPGALGGGGAPPASVPLGPPSVGAGGRQVSDNPMPSLGRSVSSFVRDFIDESASLMSAPPASAVPPSLSSVPSFGGGGSSGLPPLRAGASFSELADIPGMEALPSLSRQDSLSRRSPRISSPRNFLS